MNFSKTQIDKLGERLKGGHHTESDLRLLDDYRRSFGDAYEFVFRTIREGGEFPRGRWAKTRDSIVNKLCRESLRLSQMQDIAGCRVVVVNIVQQDQFVASLRTFFPGATVIDRREKPSYGYRAVHIIAEVSGKPVEIQVRTELQQKWAEISEKLSDVDSAIKYGGGPDELRKLLASASQMVAAYEKKETECLNDEAAYENLLANYKNFTAEQLDIHLPDHEAQIMRDKLEYFRTEIEAAEKNMKASKEDLASDWNEIWNELRGFMGELNWGLFD